MNRWYCDSRVALICCQWHFNGRFPIALYPTMTYTAAWNMLLLTFFYCSVSHGAPTTDLHKRCATNIKDFLVKNPFLTFSLRVTGLPRSWIEGLYLLKRDKVGEVPTLGAIILLQDGRSAKMTKCPVTCNCFPLSGHRFPSGIAEMVKSDCWRDP